ncbi:hypothetical protein Tco_1345533, partial [Tanacetum coccineum]
EGLHKGYDRFQSLLSQLEIHGACVSTENANQKFIRSLPSSWSHVSLVIRTKPGVDSLSLDDLYNNLRVFKSDVKGSTGSSSSAQNVAFVSSESTSSTNDVSTAYGISTSSGYNSQRENSLVTLDGEGVDWAGHVEDEKENFALMAYSNSGSDTKNFQSSSKGLSKLLNTQMSTRDKSGLGSSDVEDSPVYDRFAKVEGMHVVPPPMTRNYMPPKSDLGIDELNFTYGPILYKTSESDATTSDFDSCETNSSVETLKSVIEPVVVEPKVVSQPKVWSDALIIEEYESDSDDEYVIKPSKEQEKPSFAFVNTVKHVKTPRETVKEQNTCSPSPKVNKRD